MTVGPYTMQAAEILGERGLSAELRRDGENTAHARLASTNVQRNGTPERLSIAREALDRAEAKARARSTFAVLTLAHNGKPVAVNPERVLHVTTWDNDDATSVVLTHGDPIRVRESVAEAVEKLDAVAA